MIDSLVEWSSSGGKMVEHYLIQTLQEEMSARKEVFTEIIAKLEQHGECRGVYHSLAYVLFGDALSEDTANE